MIDAGYGVRLGPVERRHIEQLRAWRNTPAIFRWCRQRDLISDLDQELWFERQNADASTKMYVIFDADRPVGVCGLTSIDLYNRRAEFSLYIAPSLHGAGFGHKALATLLNHAFRALGLNCVWGETFDGNPAAGMFERIGMKREGSRREFYYKDGKYVDAHLYSILASEWFTRGAPVARAATAILRRVDTEPASHLSGYAAVD